MSIRRFNAEVDFSNGIDVEGSEDKVVLSIGKMRWAMTKEEALDLAEDLGALIEGGRVTHDSELFLVSGPDGEHIRMARGGWSIILDNENAEDLYRFLLEVSR